MGLARALSLEARRREMKLNKDQKLTGIITELEMRFTPNSRSLASWRLVNDAGEKTACEAWDDLADIVIRQYDDGSLITVTGYTAIRRWTTRDGSTVTRGYFSVRAVL
jgi:single-stranded DNA-binding protein